MDPSTDRHCVVLCTCGTPENAREIARALVERRLAACVNVIEPIRSIYRWEGEVHDDTESLLVIKTESRRFEAVRDAVTELHPYEVPEILCLPLRAGSAPYLAWLSAQVE